MEPSDQDYTDTSPADELHSNILVIVDKSTGGVVMDRLPLAAPPPQASANPLVTVNKSTGVITFRDIDANPANGTQGRILLPDGSITQVALENRALRALYRVKNEFAVQVLKAASHYTASATNPPGAGQFFVDTSLPRLYFPRMDGGRKVNVGELNYIDGSGRVRQILGQDFLIRTDSASPLPYIDLGDVDTTAVRFVNPLTDPPGYGMPAKDVKGASLAVRVLWNPNTFFLGLDAIENMNRLDRWGQGWRRSTNETFIERGEVSQW